VCCGADQQSREVAARRADARPSTRLQSNLQAAADGSMEGNEMMPQQRPRARDAGGRPRRPPAAELETVHAQLVRERDTDDAVLARRSKTPLATIAPALRSLAWQPPSKGAPMHGEADGGRQRRRMSPLSGSQLLLIAGTLCLFRSGISPGSIHPSVALR
jgi:hypothetical protein